MKGNPFRGVGYFLHGFSLILKPGVRRYVIIPLLINVLLFGTAVWLAVTEFSTWIELWLAQLPSMLDFLRWLMWPLFAIAILVLLFFGFAIVGNLVAAPFNSWLAEAVEKHLKGQPIEQIWSWQELPADITRSLMAELIKLMYLLRWGLLFLLLLFIPVIGQILWLAFSAWMLAVEYSDYPLANHGTLFPEQRRRLGKERLTAYGFGGCVLGAMIIPGLNFLAIPVATAGATAWWVKQETRI